MQKNSAINKIAKKFHIYDNNDSNNESSAKKLFVI